MWKKKRLTGPAAAEKIACLQAQREETKARIRKIRAGMQALIAQAAEADDLDRKVLSMDYEAQKELLAVETEHFTDLNRLIAQLHGVQMAQTRQDTLSHIQQAGACIDTDALIRAEDALAVRREMKREEDERMSAAFAAAAAEAPEMPENEEFARLVRQAQALRAENAPAQREAEKIPV